jgi:hypothetical protein
MADLKRFGFYLTANFITGIRRTANYDPFWLVDLFDSRRQPTARSAVERQVKWTFGACHDPLGTQCQCPKQQQKHAKNSRKNQQPK